MLVVLIFHQPDLLLNPCKFCPFLVKFDAQIVEFLIAFSDSHDVKNVGECESERVSPVVILRGGDVTLFAKIIGEVIPCFTLGDNIICPLCALG